MDTKYIHDMLHSIKITKFEDIPLYMSEDTGWGTDESISNFINLLNQHDELNITVVELVQLFAVYYHRNSAIEIFHQIECFDNLFLASKICVESLDNYLFNDNDKKQIESLEIFLFYFKSFIKIYNDWKKIIFMKNVFPSLLQYHLFISNNETDNAVYILDTIKKIYPDYAKMYELLKTHFSTINKHELLIVQVCEYFIEYGFIDLYKQIQEGNMEDITYYLKTVKDYIYDMNNIDVDFFVENLQNKTFSDMYITQLTEFIVRELNTKVLSFYYDIVKLIYFNNLAVRNEVFILFFLSIVIKVLTKNLEI